MCESKDLVKLHHFLALGLQFALIKSFSELFLCRHFNVQRSLLCLTGVCDPRLVQLRYLSANTIDTTQILCTNLSSAVNHWVTNF